MSDDTLYEAALRETIAENARLRALVAEAAEILDGDGEYPETAKRFREAINLGGSGADPDYCERCNTSHASIDCPDARHQQSQTTEKSNG